MPVPACACSPAPWGEDPSAQDPRSPQLRTRCWMTGLDMPERLPAQRPKHPLGFGRRGTGSGAAPLRHQVLGHPCRTPPHSPVLTGVRGRGGGGGVEKGVLPRGAVRGRRVAAVVVQGVLRGEQSRARLGTGRLAGFGRERGHRGGCARARLWMCAGTKHDRAGWGHLIAVLPCAGPATASTAGTPRSDPTRGTPQPGSAWDTCPGLIRIRAVTSPERGPRGPAPSQEGAQQGTRWHGRCPQGKPIARPHEPCPPMSCTTHGERVCEVSLEGTPAPGEGMGASRAGAARPARRQLRISAGGQR